MNYETALIALVTSIVMAIFVKPRRSRSRENLRSAALDESLRWVVLHHLWKGTVEFPTDLRDPDNFAALRKLVGFGFVNCLTQVRPITGDEHEAAACHRLKNAGAEMRKRVVMPSEAILGRFTRDPGVTQYDAGAPHRKGLLDESRRVPTPEEDGDPLDVFFRKMMTPSSEEPEPPPSVIVDDQGPSENIVEEPPIAPSEPEAPPKVNEGPRPTLLMGSGPGLRDPFEPTPPKKKE